MEAGGSLRRNGGCLPTHDSALHREADTAGASVLQGASSTIKSQAHARTACSSSRGCHHPRPQGLVQLEQHFSILKSDGKICSPPGLWGWTGAGQHQFWPLERKLKQAPLCTLGGQAGGRCCVTKICDLISTVKICNQ